MSRFVAAAEVTRYGISNAVAPRLMEKLIDKTRTDVRSREMASLRD